MKKTMKLALLVCLALFACALIFTACDSGNKPQTPSGTTAGNTTAHVHSFGEWTTVKEATCAQKGEQERVCACGEKETQSIDMIAHIEAIDAAIAPTCTADGKTEGKHCSVCNEVFVVQEVVKANGHTEVIDEAVTPTCTQTGLTEGKHCSVCNEVLVAQEVIEANGHTEVTDEAVAPTCTETGLTEGKHCSVCNEVTLAQEEIPTSHNAPHGVCENCNTITDENAALNYYYSFTSNAIGSRFYTYWDGKV